MTLFTIHRNDGKIWSHNGAKLGDRAYYWLDEWVLWANSIGCPATWCVEKYAELATKTVGGRVLMIPDFE